MRAGDFRSGETFKKSDLHQIKRSRKNNIQYDLFKPDTRSESLRIEHKGNSRIDFAVAKILNFDYHPNRYFLKNKSQ